MSNRSVCSTLIKPSFVAFYRSKSEHVTRTCREMVKDNARLKKYMEDMIIRQIDCAMEGTDTGMVLSHHSATLDSMGATFPFGRTGSKTSKRFCQKVLRET